MSSLLFKAKSAVATLLHRLPHVKTLHKESVEFAKNSCFPPGHFYSPIVSVDNIRSRENQIWKTKDVDGIPGIDLHTSLQLETLSALSLFYSEMPFGANSEPGLRYYFDNHYYSYSDGIILYSMMRQFQPAKIIEAGSGFSSAVMLDVNERFFNNSINLSFIEPFPDRLNSLLTDSDRKNVTINEQTIQSIDLAIFETLNENDFLFIDSTHIVKTGSDVNFILFEILPRLKKGVIIHFHDIFYPFEYPKQWVYEGRNWNENYVLKSFLMYNRNFEILFFSDYMHKFYPDHFKDMPLTYTNPGGNIWLRKGNNSF